MRFPLPSSLRRCDGVSRRDFLQVGTLGALGVNLASMLRLSAHAEDQPKATSCILIWLDGGPSHLDTFDPKPEAPAEIRSPFKAIGTSVDGIQICEHLPRVAKAMGDIALIRSLTHELGNHDTGSRFLLTGNRPTPALDHPSLGSVVAHSQGFRGEMPPYVAIPNTGAGGTTNAAGPGWLPGSCSAFAVGNDPSRVSDLDPPEGVSFARNMHRREMLETMDRFSRHIETGRVAQDRDAYYDQAYRLIASPEAKAAFDLSREKASSRELYGPSRVGTGCLLARRLVEAGSRFVTVVDTGWDTHQQIARELPDSRFPGSGKLPNLDRAYAALLSDLRERGLLDSTLVVLMGEFGRTPKLNAQGGRDHWPRAGFACLSGGGTKGGQLIGATDPFGEAPVDRPVSPSDLAFSILSLLGVDPSRELVAPGGRPLKILTEGRFIAGLT